jgi:uncharacterized protein YjbI with pentapeptide repeats
MRQIRQWLRQDYLYIRAFWPRRKHILIAAIAAYIILLLATVGRQWEWTGTGKEAMVPGATIIQVYEPDKDLWDWMQLLLVPAVLAIGGLLFQRAENRYQLELQERRSKEVQQLEDGRSREMQAMEDRRQVSLIESEERRFQENRYIEEQRSQDRILQDYLDQMTQLILHENLNNSQPVDQVRVVARARTLTALKSLNGDRKRILITFLYEAHLIQHDKKDVIISLKGADLTNTDLSNINLSWSDLRGINFLGCNLTNVDLSHCDLTKVDFTGVILNKSRFDRARLVHTNFTKSFLEETSFFLIDIRYCNFKNCTANDARFHGDDTRRVRGHDAVQGRITYSNFSNATMKNAQFVNMFLHDVSFRDANLEITSFNVCTLNNVNFQDAFMDGAEILYSTLKKVYVQLNKQGVKAIGNQVDDSGWTTDN